MEDCFKHIELGAIDRFGEFNNFSIDSRSSKGYTFLSFAVRKGSLKTVSYILRKGADINYRERDGAAPLMLGIYLGRYDVVQLLVMNGADVRCRDCYDTPLTLAVRENHLDIVKFLVENGADVEDTNVKGLSPLFLSIKDNKVDILDFFLENIEWAVDNVNNTPLIAAVRNNCSLNVIAIFLKHGTYLDDSENEKTPLAWASEMGNVELVEILLSNGADINLLSQNGETALATAVQYKQREVAEYLVGRGCNVCKVGEDGKTPLYWAVCNEDTDIIKILLEHGAQYMINSVFHDAIETVNLEIVKLLYETEKLFSLPDVDDYLSVAVSYENFDIAKYFIENGAKNEELDYEIAMNAFAGKSTDCMMAKLLIENGLKLNTFGGCTHTPLTRSVTMENFELVRYLVAHGADVNQANARGLTPLATAVANDDFQILQHLVNSGAIVSEEDKKENSKLAKYYKMLKEAKPKQEISSNQEECSDS